MKLSGAKSARHARVILKAPRSVIFDERRAPLDSATDQEIPDPASPVSAERTTVGIAPACPPHRADEILVLPRPHHSTRPAWRAGCGDAS